VPKRKTADARGSSEARRRLKQPPSIGGRKLSNWAAAQWRAARNWASHALRLVIVALAGLVGLAAVLLLALGRMDDLGERLTDSAEDHLEAAGYTLDWLDVSGADRTGVEEIALAVGVAPHRGLTRVDLERARVSVEALSWVRSAQVLRLWPDRIAVLIEERVPFALWQINQAFHVIDETGVVINAADPRNFGNLPNVVGAGADQAAREIVKLLGYHDEVRSRVTHAVRVVRRRWSLRLVSGGDVLLPETDPASALTILAVMHEERGVLDYDAQIFDLRNNGEMVMRPWPDKAAQVAGRGA